MILFTRIASLIAFALVTTGARASLDDDFLFSSKLGLLTESVTTTWTEQEDGLIYGGQLNGVPRDSWHDLYYLNGRLTKIVIGYAPEPLYFETEKASRKWTYEALQALVARAEKKYGPPKKNTLMCADETAFKSCGGSALWVGARKTFEIRAHEQELSDVTAAYFNFDKMLQVTFSYTSTADFDLLSARLPYLVRAHNDRVDRRFRRKMLEALGPYLRRTNQSLDEVILNWADTQGRINEILRDDGMQYIGGVKANYKPERWARSFRLQ